MKEKWNSLRFRVLFSCIVSSALVMATFMIYGIYNVYKYRADYLATNQYVIDFYSEQIEAEWLSLKDYVASVFSDNVSYNALANGNLTEASRIKAEYYLTNTLESKANSIRHHGGLFYYDRSINLLRSKYSDAYSSDQFYFINLELKELMSEQTENTATFYTDLDGYTCLFYIQANKEQYVGCFLDLDRFFANTMVDSEEDVQMLFIDEKGDIITSVGQSIVTPQEMGGAIGQSWLYGYRYATLEGKNSRALHLVMVRPYSQLYLFWMDIPFWLFIIIIPLVMGCLLWMIYRTFRQVLLLPADRLLMRVQQLEAPGSVPEKPDISRIREFREIDEKLAHMIDKINVLQKKNYLAEIDAQNALLQCYRMQINPHFYINCLNTMLAMLDNGQYDTVTPFIFSLSRYMRKTFHNITDTVPLKKEINAADEYYSLITLLYGEPFLYRTNVEEGLGHCLIPFLCIQTFLENSVKHARKQGKILSVLITAESFEENGQSKVLIRIEDNGDGYPNAQLEQLNDPNLPSTPPERHVGIYNIRYRTRALYGSTARIAFYNRPHGGAVTEVVLPKTWSEQCEEEDIDC